jgi:hypothetical protein
MNAYDYEKQKWVEGREGAAVRQAQLEEELELLTGPRALEYLEFTRKTKGPTLHEGHVKAAIEVCRRGIAECDREIEGHVPEFFGDPGSQEFEPRDYNDADGIQTMRDFG